MSIYPQFFHLELLFSFISRYINFPMTNIECHGHRSNGSREDDFKGFYRVWERGSCWSRDLDRLDNFLFPPPRRLYTKFDNDWPKSF